ncbi:WbqC family protein [Paenibacillus spongiae]|uniref:WbqC family protein n=1 Tax=Paenibacillus spongiae TaxID=2909671 RepID=A0ABY5S723_9BACL|nr:WbqC family protein [Paenibacillus spongiae]UVI28647.1 WbqC family protein [Paenibacillus spongiae]
MKQVLKKICIYQPNVFPPLHYFNRIMNSDMWVMLDDVQINRKVGQTRFSLKINGDKHVRTVPLLGGNRIKINEAAITYQEDWIAKLQKTFDHAYARSPYFEMVRSIVFNYIDLHQRMNTGFHLFCEQFTIDMLRMLGWQGSVISSTGMTRDSRASERMAEIVHDLNGTHYVCGGEGFRQYVELDHFRRRSLSVIVQDWRCPEYPQSKGKFVPNLSILDLIANVGLNGAKELLVSGGTAGWRAYS